MNDKGTLALAARAIDENVKLRERLMIAFEALEEIAYTRDIDAEYAVEVAEEAIERIENE